MSLPTESILPSADILNDFEHGRYVLSNLAAKRAKQLKDGAPPLVRVESGHPLTIALAEIAAGKIKPIFGVEDPEALVDVGLPVLNDDDDSLAELGMLLPALEDEEDEEVAAALVDFDLEDEVEEDDEESDDEEPASLADLLEEDDVEEEEETEVEPVDGDDTVSLDEVEAGENQDEEEED